jgi:hypothetical protein
MSVNIKNMKEEKRVILTKSLSLPKNTRAIVLCYIQDESLKEFLRDAANALWVSLLTGIDDKAREGADAFITDVLDESVPFDELLKNIVIPIIPRDKRYEKTLTEFNPMKFEGNAFIFEEANKFLMFEKLVRYLENIRYPWDKRTLLQNIEKTTL